MPRLHLVFLALVTVIGVAACAAPASTGIRTVGAEEAVSMLGDRTVIDVRTPAETADGMVEGAINLDVQSPDFRERLGQLDHDGSYLLYCRSGNRSAQAAAVMADLGFTDVVDAGGFDALVAAGAPTGP